MLNVYKRKIKMSHYIINYIKENQETILTRAKYAVIYVVDGTNSVQGVFGSDCRSTEDRFFEIRMQLFDRYLSNDEVRYASMDLTNFKLPKLADIKIFSPIVRLHEEMGGFDNLN